MGGSKDGVLKSNRDVLYKLSKMYKDVASGVFPLGPNIDENDVDIPKISVKKAARELMEKNEEIRVQNKDEKRKLKKRKLEESEIVNSNDGGDGVEVAEDVEENSPVENSSETAEKEDLLKTNMGR